ncbi:MAG TPA: hypothetical protein VFO52_02460, partial [Longimicrobiales bacterium]|nr:hypothetical protein [Longimicrobiales bacterium]
NYDAFAAGEFIPQELAAEIVWFDALLTNPDRTHRNPNILICERHPWLIDHGAALYAHHSWSSVDAERTRTPFPLIRDHVLLRAAVDLEAADDRLHARLDPVALASLLAAVPDALLLDPIIAGEFSDSAAARQRYHDYLMQRLAAPRAFVAEAVQARETRLHEPVQRRRARR